VGRKKYSGPLHTVEHAFMAHGVLRITCQRCKHYKQLFAWKVYELARDKIVGMPLDKPISGFKCRGCGRGATVVVRMVGTFDYGT
jgi:hypothetical protein